MAALEKYIRENKEQFDDQSPRPNLWHTIEAQLFGKGRQGGGIWHSLGFWRAAAAVLLLVSIGFTYHTFKVPAQKELSALEKEFAEIEVYYFGQLAEKASLINTAQSAWADDPYSQDLLKLEAMYMVLKEEMRKEPSQELKDALVLNLIIRLDIMNKTLEEAEALKEEKSI